MAIGPSTDAPADLSDTFLLASDGKSLKVRLAGDASGWQDTTGLKWFGNVIAADFTKSFSTYSIKYHFMIFRDSHVYSFTQATVHTGERGLPQAIQAIGYCFNAPLWR